MTVTTTNSQSIDIVNAFMDDVVNGRDYDRIDDLQTEDFVFHGMPSGAELQGTEESEQMTKMYHDAFSDLESSEILSFADEAGEYVCTVRSFTGTNDGSFLGQEPTGNVVDVMGLSVFRIEDGQIAERWNGLDHLGLLQQLDIVAPTNELSA
jgi:predicted ester cyclase